MTLATRLPLPLKDWFEGMADDSWRLLLDEAYGYVNQRYQSEVHGFYAKAIQRRYPFNAHAVSDVALADFQAFFKARGVLAHFYEGCCGRYPRRWASGMSWVRWARDGTPAVDRRSAGSPGLPPDPGCRVPA